MPLTPSWWADGDFRPLDDGAVLFDPVSWETHILNPPAAALVELIFEQFRHTAPDEAAAHTVAGRVLEWDTASPSFQQTLQVLIAARLVRAAGD